MEQKDSLKSLLHGLPKKSIVTCRAVCEVPAFGIVTKFYLVRVMLRGVQGKGSKGSFNERIIRLLFQLKLIIFKLGNETLDLTKSDFSHRLLRHDLGTQPVYEWRRLLFTTGYSSDHSFHRCCRQHQKHWMLENERTNLDHKISRRPFCYSVSNFDLFSLVWSPIFPELGHFKTITQAQLFSFFSMSFF